MQLSALISLLSLAALPSVFAAPGYDQASPRNLRLEPRLCRTLTTSVGTVTSTKTISKTKTITSVSTATSTTTAAASTCSLPAGPFLVPQGCGSGNQPCGATPSVVPVANYVSKCGDSNACYIWEYVPGYYMPYPQGDETLYSTTGASLDDCVSQCLSKYGSHNNCPQVVYQHSTGNCFGVTPIGDTCQNGYCGSADFDSAFVNVDNCQYLYIS